MLIFDPSSAFKKDFQKLAARRYDILKAFLPIALLLNRMPLPSQYQDHPLKGQWAGYREFHVEPDWVFIYQINGEYLTLARTGSHSDLFKK
jgi:mRNA interferase YafQ